MNVPANLIFIWPSTNASIPSGFSRETALDSKFPKGTADATDPNISGGNNNHDHTSPAHSHSMVAHSHSITTDGNVGSDQQNSGSGAELIRGNHTHTGTIGGSSGGSLASTASTYGSASSLPPYYEVIYIKSLGTPAGVPNNAIALYSSTTLPTSWVNCDGNNSTPNLGNKYLHGAAAGGNAGATGGSYTNVHSLTHTHTVNSHTHSGTSSQASPDQTRGGTSGSNSLSSGHSHTISLNAATDTIDNTAPSLTTSETVEPAYTKLLAIQNQTGGENLQLKIIALWLGTLATIPFGWDLCDGTNGTVDMRGRHLKIAVDTSEIGNTGGSNTHTHGSQSHNHTSTGSHTHTGSASSHVNEAQPNSAGQTTRSAGGNEHTLTSVSSVTATYNSANTTADSSNNEPAYLTVAFLQLNRLAILGSML